GSDRYIDFARHGPGEREAGWRRLAEGEGMVYGLVSSLDLTPSLLSIPLAAMPSLPHPYLVLSPQYPDLSPQYPCHAVPTPSIPCSVSSVP
ncbi:hypothetical protein Pmani_034930, partial [Petrolisthes manimaculis]